MSFRNWSTLGGLAIAAAVCWFSGRMELTDHQSWTAAVTVLCMIWWVCESIPAAATATLPLVVLPLSGVLSEREVAAAYGDPVILLFMGAFMASTAVERWGAHRRIAHAIVANIGSTSGPRILLAMMLTTLVCHFGVNNTAVALMMTPVALAIVERDATGKLAVPLVLGVAYCASIGGIMTPISTAPNGIFQAVYKELAGHTIPFYKWMIVGGVTALFMAFATWAVLAWGIRGVPSVQMETEGEWTTPQRRTLFVCGLAAIGWITRDIPYGGWQQWVPKVAGKPAAGDMTVAICAALLMFLIPSGERRESGERCDSRLLDWKTAATIPWGVLVLFGGGIAIAKAFEASELSKVVGQAVYGIQDWPPVLLIGVLCLAVTFLSEFTSNTATAAILMPILGAAAKSNGMDPALLMFPATLANSLAFMMPVGTPPNAIAYGTGRVRIINMVRYGFVLNLIGVIIVTLVCWQLLPLVLGVSVGSRSADSTLNKTESSFSDKTSAQTTGEAEDLRSTREIDTRRRGTRTRDATKKRVNKARNNRTSSRTLS